MESVMVKSILAVAALLALLVAVYLGCRLREWIAWRRMTTSLGEVEVRLGPRVFTGSQEYDRAAAALLAEERFLRQQIANARGAHRSVRTHRPDVELLLKDVEGLCADNDVLSPKRGAILKGYVSEIDNSLQTYSVFVPEGYDGSSAFPLVVSLHGHRWFAPFQGHPAPAFAGAIVLSPEGRGPTDFMWIGEEDVLRTIDEVRKDYLIDDQRVFVTGGSMGGTGAWNLAVHHPRLFAGVGPTAANCDFRAWEKRWGWNRHLPGQHRDLRDYLLASDSPITYARNLAHTPVYVVHASGDNVVPVEHAREAVRVLRAVGAPVEYREFLAGTHGKFPEYIAQEQLAWLAARPRTSPPAEYHFETRSIRQGESFYTTIEQMEEVLKPATVDVQFDGTTLSVQTSNVLVLRVRPADMPAPAGGIRRPVTLKLDRQTMTLDVGADDPAVCFLKESGTWRRLETWPPDDAPRKVRGVEGPVQDVFLAPFTVVVGARDESWFKAAEVEAWRFVGEWARRFPGTTLRVIPDDGVTDEMLRKRNIIFFGRPAGDRPMKRVFDAMPIKVTDDAVTVADSRFTGSDVGTIFCYPTPEAPGRMTAVFSAVSPDALYQVATRFGNWFNWGVHDQRKWFDYCVYDGTTANPETYPLVGFFGTDWSLGRGRSWRSTSEAEARVKPQGRPRYAAAPEVKGLSLSDLQPTLIDQMRGAVGFDRSFRGNALVIEGEPYERGLGVRCPSRIEFPLEGGFERLSAVVGFTNEPDETLSAIRLEKEQVTFLVIGDGKVLHSEKVDWLKKPAARIDVDVHGVRKLALCVEPSGGALWLHGSGAWADVKVEKAGVQ